MADPRNKLVNALRELASAKNISKISVNDILERAEVSRQTFYKYFPDKYALSFYVYLQDIAKLAVDSFVTNKDFDAMNLLILETIEKHPAFYKNMFNDSSSQNSFVAQYHQYDIEQTSEFIGGAHITPDLELLIDMYSSGTERLIARWVTTGMKEDKQHIVSMFRRAMPEELKPYLLKE